MRGIVVMALGALAVAACGDNIKVQVDAGPGPCSINAECDDGNPCTVDQCIDNACDNAIEPTLEGEECDDGLACTVDTRCVAGACTGEPLDCASMSDFCNTGTCSEAAGGCVLEPMPDGTTCDDAMFCTVGDSCTAGLCGGTARDCSSAGDQCNTGVCDESLASCTGMPVMDGTGCDDGLFCTVNDGCMTGACTGGGSQSCDDTDVCTTDSCDEAADACDNVLTPNPGAEGPPGNPTCGDGDDNDCDLAIDLADPNCVQCVVPADCDDGNPCTNQTCTMGVCGNPNRPDGSPCDDLFCQIAETCTAGVCGGGTPNCVDGMPCTADVCDEVAMTCSNPAPQIDPASAVTVGMNDGTPLTACVVAGSAARVLAWVDLQDTTGAPLVGATVTIGGSPATASTAAPGVYWREIVAGAVPGPSTLPVVATVCGDTENLTPIAITTVAANATAGGTGGCSPAGGNVRVRVVDETGAPINNASVLVGSAAGNPFQHSPEALFGGGPPASTNLATTNAMGYVAFYDYGGALAGPITVTAGANNRALFTLAGGDASDVVLALPLLHPPVAATTIYGNTAGSSSTWPPTGCVDVDAGIVLPKLGLDFFSAVDIAQLFGKERCWDTMNGLVGVVAIPENLYLPAQSIGPLCLGGSLAQAPWSLALDNGTTENVGMVLASAPYDDVQAALSGGGLEDLLAILTYRRIGFFLNESVPTPPTGNRSVVMNETYPNNFTVTYSGRPAEADVVGLTAADYAGTSGSGPTFLIGSAVHPFDVAGSSITIPNSDLNATGGGVQMPQKVRRFASVAAMYLDDAAHPGIPANRRGGVTTVLLRGGASPPFGPTGGTGSVTSWLAISGTTFTAPSTFTWENATANGNQPLYSVHELTIESSRFHPVLAACQTENEVRADASVQWIVVKPFALDCAGSECFTLPSLPPSFPRYSASPARKSGFEALVGSGAACTPGSCSAGETCVDPDGAGSAAAMCMGGTGTANDPYFTQALAWKMHLYDLELAPAFDFDAFAFADRILYLTHESSNAQPFQ
jgi:hypothetical protein